MTPRFQISEKKISCCGGTKRHIVVVDALLELE